MKKCFLFFSVIFILFFAACGESSTHIARGDDDYSASSSSRFIYSSSADYYTLSVSASPSAGGTVSHNPYFTSHESGARVTITAVPANDYEFSHWETSGLVLSYDSSYSLTMDADRKVIAVFTRKKIPANAVIITLTRWVTKDTDVGGVDPRIHFVVTAFRNKKRISSNATAYLINGEDVASSWNGHVKSAPVPFASQADSLVIDAVVVEKDLLANDDISPGYVNVWTVIPEAGSFGSRVMDYGNRYSRVEYDYEFIAQ